MAPLRAEDRFYVQHTCAEAGSSRVIMQDRIVRIARSQPAGGNSAHAPADAAPHVVASARAVLGALCVKEQRPMRMPAGLRAALLDKKRDFEEWAAEAGGAGGVPLLLDPEA
jgi:acyl-CoA thioesterase FadM